MSDRCPRCPSGLTKVIDSRPGANREGIGHTIRRRRGCAGCGHRWTTYEVTEEAFEAIIAAIDAKSELRAHLSGIAEMAKGLLKRI